MSSAKAYVALGLGAAGFITSVLLFRNEVSSKNLSTPICLEVLEKVRSHKGVVHFLGEPIEPKKAKFNNLSIAIDKYAEVKMHVVGPKSYGIVFYTYTEDDVKNKILRTIQLQIGKDDTKRLVVLDSSKTT